MPETTFPGVFVEETSSSTRPIVAASTSTAAFIGEAECGPLDQALLLSSYSDFEQYYGKPLTDHYLAWSVRLFFENGGTRCYVARVATNSRTSLDEQLYKNAFSLLDDVTDISLIALPGIVTPDIHQFASEYCEHRQDCFFIADLAFEHKSVNDAASFIKNLRHKSSYTAVYFPWLQVTDKLNNNVLLIPPSGAVAGIYARIDHSRGVWKAPAGDEATLNGICGLSLPVSDQEQGNLNPLGVNVIRDISGIGPVVWGSRTLATQSDPEFRYVPVRRTAIYIEQSIQKNIRWADYKADDAGLWSDLKQKITNFLHNLYKSGAFVGSRPVEAYYIQSNSHTTTSFDIDNAGMNIVLGFAPLKPAEFVVIKIQQNKSSI